MKHTVILPLALPLALIGLAVFGGCNNSTQQDVVGELGWDFNYRDWTKERCVCPDLAESDCGTTAGCAWDGTACGDTSGVCTEDDLRSCNNNPANLGGAPSFPVVDEITISIRDIESGQVGFEVDIACDLGESGALFPLQGLARVQFNLFLFGRTADGTLIYAHDDPYLLDLSETAEHRFDIITTVGDIQFGATFPGTAFLCPDDTVDRFRWSVFELGETTPFHTGEQDACDVEDIFGNIQGKTVYIRNIDVDPIGGVSGFVLDTYRVQVEAVDSSDNVLYCGDQTRPVSPGPNVLQDSIALSAGDCP